MIPIRFNTRPSRTMVRILICEVLNMIALGGVATGSMKAQLQLRAAGTISSLKSMSAATAVAARTGIRTLAVAVLLVSSVKKVVSVQVMEKVRAALGKVVPQPEPEYANKLEDESRAEIESIAAAFGSNVTGLVPIPAALPLMGSALALLGFMGWRNAISDLARAVDTLDLA